MSDWILTYTALGIYIGAVIGVLSGMVYPEIRHLSIRKDDFREKYQDKLSVLRTKAENALILSISNAEKLKEIFGQPMENSKVHSFTREDEYKIEEEITDLEERLDDLTRPKYLFRSVIEDYDEVLKRLKILSAVALIFSLFIPIGIISDAALPQNLIFDPLITILVFGGYLAAIALWVFYSRYSKANKHLKRNRQELIEAITTKVYEVTDEFDETFSFSNEDEE